MNVSALKPFIIVPVCLDGDLPAVGWLRALEPLRPNFIVANDVQDAYQRRREATMLQFIGEVHDLHGVAKQPIDYTVLTGRQPVSLQSLERHLAPAGLYTPVVMASEAAAAELLKPYPSAAPALAGDEPAIIAVRPVPPTQLMAKRIGAVHSPASQLLARRLLGL